MGYITVERDQTAESCEVNGLAEDGLNIWA